VSKHKSNNPDASVGTLMWRHLKLRHTNPRMHRKWHKEGKTPGKLAQITLSERRAEHHTK